MTFAWDYLYLDKEGKLVDGRGYIINNNRISFQSIDDAEEWLVSEDIRAHCVGYWKDK